MNTDTQPVFPQEFVNKHCSQVREAASWRRHYKLPPDPEDDQAHAECSFRSAGVGLLCESCDMFLVRPFCGHQPSEEFLSQIEKYYSDMKVWEQGEQKRQQAKQKQEQVEQAAMDSFTSSSL